MPPQPGESIFVFVFGITLSQKRDVTRSAAESQRHRAIKIIISSPLCPQGLRRLICLIYIVFVPKSDADILHDTRA